MIDVIGWISVVALVVFFGGLLIWIGMARRESKHKADERRRKELNEEETDEKDN